MKLDYSAYGRLPAIAFFRIQLNEFFVSSSFKAAGAVNLIREMVLNEKRKAKRRAKAKVK
jgi:hypothetical protein